MTDVPVVETQALSHGTLELRDLEETHRFYREFLGLNAIKISERGQYVWSGGEWIIVCLKVGDALERDQGPENAWRLSLGGADEVRKAHATAVRDQAHWKIKAITALEGDGEECAFSLQDLDGNWWRIDAHTPAYFDRVFGS